MRKTFLIHDIAWFCFSVLVCLGGIRLGFGSFQEPAAGFMPFVAGLSLALLAILDFFSGFLDRRKGKTQGGTLWGDTDWKRIILTLLALFTYTILLTTVGYVVGTVLLLLFLFRGREKKPWWIVLTASVLTTALSYLVFTVGLEAQLPKGFMGL